MLAICAGKRAGEIIAIFRIAGTAEECLVRNIFVNFMKKNNNGARKIIIGFVAVCFFVLSLCAQAFDVSKVNVKDLELESVFFGSGDALRGDFAIENDLAEPVDIYYRISLLFEGKVFGEEMFKAKDQIQPSGSIKQEFEYAIPGSARSGDYILKAQLFLNDGTALNWAEQGISIIGKGIYLNITGSSILRNTNSFDSRIIVDFYSDEIPKISFLVYNPTDEIISFKPHIFLYNDRSEIVELDNYFAERKDLNPKKNENMTIDLPQFEKPGIYLAKVQLENGGMPLSNIESFRWTVSERAARITRLAVPENIFLAGKENSVSVDFIGNPGISEDGNAELSFGVYDISGNVIETQNRQIILSPISKKEVFKIDVGQDLKNLKIGVKINRNGKEVDSREGTFNVKSKSTGNRKNASLVDYKSILMLISGLIVFLAFKFFKKNNRSG